MTRQSGEFLFKRAGCKPYYPHYLFWGSPCSSVFQGGGFHPGGYPNSQREDTGWSPLWGALSSLDLALEQETPPSQHLGPEVTNPGLPRLAQRGSLSCPVWRGWGSRTEKEGSGPRVSPGVKSCWESWHLAIPCLFGAFSGCLKVQEAAPIEFWGEGWVMLQPVSGTLPCPTGY